MKRSLSLLVCLILVTPVHAGRSTIVVPEDSWANWEHRMTDAFEGIPSIKLPGRTLGILVPNDERTDIFPLFAFGHEVLSHADFHSVIILMQAPLTYQLDGLAVPGGDSIETPFGHFDIDTGLRDRLLNGAHPVVSDPTLFQTDVPKSLQNQLAALKYLLRKNIRTLKVLPVYVKFSDANSQSKDYGPFLVDRIRDFGADSDLVFIVCANLNRASSETYQIKSDSAYLKAVRNLDIEGLIAAKNQTPDVEPASTDFDALLLGVLTLRWFGSDHSEILSYANSGQLLLTKDRKIQTTFASAGFASAPNLDHRVPHVKQVKMTDIFDELLRSDILALARQTCLSTLDPTSAKPPALDNPQAAKKWPVYVSIYDAQGNLGGQAGSHVGLEPLEESIRKYTVEAVQKAQPGLTKANAASYVIEISIPYGFENVNRPDNLIPLLNGIVVTNKRKTAAIHPELWRKYPDPHQLLSVVSYNLGLKPWDYATENSHLDSFRVLSFNEKEPFQDLGSAKKKKKKKGEDGLDEPDAGATGGGGGGGSPFGF